MRIGILGTGKIGIGPLACHKLLDSSKKILINKRSEKWKDSIQQGYLNVLNVALNCKIKIPIVTKLEDLKKHNSDELVLYLYDDVGERDKLLQNIDICFISVGKNVEEVVSTLPPMKCPIVMVENDYDTLLNLMKRSANELYPSVIDCHSSVYDLSGNLLKISYSSKMTFQILDHNHKVRNLFSCIPKEVTFCDSMEQLDVFHMTKFFGINLTHRLLVYLLLKEQYDREGKINNDEVAFFFSDSVLNKYNEYARAVVIASYIKDAEAIQKFYGVDTFEDGYAVYTDTLMILSDSIARKTEKTGDRFSRVIKYGTENYDIRLIQTRNIIKNLLESMNYETAISNMDDDAINWVSDVLMQEMQLLDTVVKY